MPDNVERRFSAATLGGKFTTADKSDADDDDGDDSDAGKAADVNELTTSLKKPASLESESDPGISLPTLLARMNMGPTTSKFLVGW